MNHNQEPPVSEGVVIVVNVNGQQESLLKDIVAGDPGGRSAEELIRYGFAEFAKQKRQQQL